MPKTQVARQAAPSRRQVLGWSGAAALPGWLGGCASGRVDITQGWFPVPMATSPWRSDRVDTPTRTILIAPNVRPGLRQGVGSVVRALQEYLNELVALSFGVRVDERALPGIAEALKSRTPLASGGVPAADAVIALDILEISSQPAPMSPEKPAAAPAGTANRPRAAMGQRGRVVLLCGVYTLPGPQTVFQVRADSGPNAATSSAPVAQLPDEVFGGAARQALLAFRHRIVDAIAPMGEVLEARQNDKGQRLVRISLGSRMGAAVDHMVVFRRLKTAPRTGERPTEDALQGLGFGRVSQYIEAGHSWVLVDDPASAAALQRGDIVRSMYAEGIVIG